MNLIVLIGRLTADPELRYSGNGVAISNFKLAVDRNFKNAQGQKETDFIPCVAYKQTAELIANYLSKGKMAGVEGRLQVRSYDAQDGQKRWVTEVIVNNIQFLSPREASVASNEGAERGYGPDNRSYGNEVDDMSDIPF